MTDYFSETEIRHHWHGGDTRWLWSAACHLLSSFRERETDLAIAECRIRKLEAANATIAAQSESLSKLSALIHRCHRVVGHVSGLHNIPKAIESLVNRQSKKIKALTAENKRLRDFAQVCADDVNHFGVSNSTQYRAQQALTGAAGRRCAMDPRGKNNMPERDWDADEADCELSIRVMPKLAALHAWKAALAERRRLAGLLPCQPGPPLESMESEMRKQEATDAKI